MFKKMYIILSFCILTSSCGTTLVNTLVNINTGEAKRFAKAVINKEENRITKYPISDNFKDYLLSSNGKDDVDEFSRKNGPLDKLKLKNINGTTTDTMRYIFIASFKTTDILREVVVKSYKDEQIVGLVLKD